MFRPVRQFLSVSFAVRSDWDFCNLLYNYILTAFRDDILKPNICPNKLKYQIQDCNSAWNMHECILHEWSHIPWSLSTRWRSLVRLMFFITTPTALMFIINCNCWKRFRVVIEYTDDLPHGLWEGKQWHRTIEWTTLAQSLKIRRETRPFRQSSLCEFSQEVSTIWEQYFLESDRMKVNICQSVWSVIALKKNTPLKLWDSSHERFPPSQCRCERTILSIDIFSRWLTGSAGHRIIVGQKFQKQIRYNGLTRSMRIFRIKGNWFCSIFHSLQK